MVNPAAGQGQALKVWDKIASILKQTGQDFAFYLTEKQGDGTRLAGQAARAGAELIVGVGGDGTLNEILNGLDFSKNILGIIPTGTGNGFRRSCGIPGNWQAALTGLSQWEPRHVDVGRVNERYFLNVVGIGFDAAVEELAFGKYKNLKGYLAYLPAFFEGLASLRFFPVNITYNGTRLDEEEALLVAINNGAYYGGAMCIAPQASVDDGNLNLTLVRKIGAAKTAVLAARAFLKKSLEGDDVQTEKVSRAIIKTAEELSVHIDGEISGSLPIIVDISPGALRILAPSK